MEYNLFLKRSNYDDTNDGGWTVELNLAIQEFFTQRSLNLTLGGKDFVSLKTFLLICMRIQ